MGSEEIAFVLDLLHQTENILPGLLAEGRADHLDHLAGRNGADGTALTQVQPLAQSGQESRGVEIACTRRVDPLGGR